MEEGGAGWGGEGRRRPFLPLAIVAQCGRLAWLV